MAERAQYASFKSLVPATDGSLHLAAKLAQVADGQCAGTGDTTPPKAVNNQVSRAFPGCSVVAGMVWLPSREIRLSTAAGAALRSRLLSARRQNLLRVVLDAVWGVLAQRLQHAGSSERMALSHAADDLISAASHPEGRRRREIKSWPDTQLQF